MSEKANATIRAKRTLKHYRNVLLTQNGDPTEETVSNLLIDLHYFCKKHNIDLVDRMNEAAIATEGA
jgi:hypothetical protein